MPGLSGRPRKPSALRSIDGGAGHRPPPPAEPQPPTGEPVKPEAVARDGVASAEWDRLVELTTLKGARVLTVADGPMLEATSRAYAEYESADSAIRDNDGALTYASSTQGGGLIRRPLPEVAIRSDAWRRWTSGLTHFGLSPATRGKTQKVDEAKPSAAARHFR